MPQAMVRGDKGQGSFESLCDVPADILFLFKVKCPVIARVTDLAVGSHALRPSRWWSRTPVSPSPARPKPDLLPD